jgi:hypothetical protein
MADLRSTRMQHIKGRASGLIPRSRAARYRQVCPGKARTLSKQEIRSLPTVAAYRYNSEATSVEKPDAVALDSRVERA